MKRLNLTKRLARAILPILAALMLVASPVLALVAYRASVAVAENGTAAHTMSGLTFPVGNRFLVNNGFISSTGLDTRIETLGGSEKPHLVAKDRTNFAIPVPLSSQTNLFYTTANSALSAFSVIPGDGGYIATKDAAALEPAANFLVDIEDAYITGTAGDIYRKSGAYGVAYDGTNVVGYIGESPTSPSQIIFGGSNDLLNGAATEYFSLMGGGQWNAIEASVYAPVPTGGSLSELSVKYSANVPAGATQILTVMKNGIATSLVVTVSAGASTGSLSNTSVSFVAGDLVSVRSTYTGAPGAFGWATWTVIWTPTIANESIFLANGLSSSVATYYVMPQGQTPAPDGTETNHNTPIPTAGTLKKLYVQLSTDPGTAPDNYRFYLRKNTANSALTVNVIADATTGNDIVNTVAVVAGDLVDYSLIPENAPTASPTAGFGMVFTPTTVGEYVVMGGSNVSTPSTAATNYTTMHDHVAWNATEGNVSQTLYTTKLSSLYVKLKAAPDSGAGAQSYTFTLRANAGTTGITVTISEANTTGNDVVNSFTTAAGTLGSMQSVPATTPTASLVHWAFVAETSITSLSDPTTAGEHRTRFSLSGGTLSLQIDADVAVTVAYAGSVLDTGGNHIWLEDVPYADYIKLTVGGTEVLEYQPATIIGGTDYTTGTAAFTNGSTAVVGTATTWTQNMVGGMIRYNADDVWHVIASVEDATNLTLTAVYSGAGGAAAAYTIAPRMPDLDAGDGVQDGRITWGTNPAGTTITLGSFVAESQPVPGTTAERPTSDILGEAGGSDWGEEPDVAGALLTHPLRPFITMVFDNTTLTESQTWLWYGIAFVLFFTGLAIRHIKGHKGLVGIAFGVSVGAVVAQSVFPIYAIVISVIAIVLGVMSERTPSL